MIMTVINKTIERIRLETRTRILTVVSVTDITPHMRRIRVGGPELEGFQSPGHADHIKVFLSADGRPLPRPERHPDGLVWPDDVPRPFMRDYTPRYLDPVALTLDLDFVLHSDGPASTWAANAKVGEPLMIGGPRGTIRVPEAFDWYFLAGDETALPAIGRRIEELPADKPVLAIIEVPKRPISSPSPRAKISRSTGSTATASPPASRTSSSKPPPAPPSRPATASPSSPARPRWPNPFAPTSSPAASPTTPSGRQDIGCEA